jgi:tRNA dimethylallyltransferase
MYVDEIIEAFKSSNFKTIIIYGATASGKSSLGLKLLNKIGNGIIINADSMQVYKEIPIITAQPHSLLNHHLYGIISINDKDFNNDSLRFSINELVNSKKAIISCNFNNMELSDPSNELFEQS